MLTMTDALTLAKWKWVGRLAEAADNDQPIAYLIAAICLAVVIIVGISFVRDCYRTWKGVPVPGGLLMTFVGSLLGIGLPMCLVYELVPRLLK